MQGIASSGFALLAMTRLPAGDWAVATPLAMTGETATQRRRRVVQMRTTGAVPAPELKSDFRGSFFFHAKAA